MNIAQLKQFGVLAILALVALAVVAPAAAAPPDLFIEITGGPGTDICTSGAFIVPIDFAVPDGTFAYSDEMVVPGVGLVSSFSDVLIGPIPLTSATYGFGPSPYTVPANTIITLRVFIYAGPTTSDPVSHLSEVYVNCTTGQLVAAPTSGGVSFNDGRLNNNDPGATFAVYCKSGGIEVWAINSAGQGSLAFFATNDEIAAVPNPPDENTIIEEGLGVRLFRLTNGSFQVVGVTDFEGKTYNLSFSACAGSAAGFTTR